MKRLAVSVSFFLIATPAMAEIQVQFYTANDGFLITNLDNCPLSDVEIKIDMSSSSGALVFDTFPGPPGLNQSQSLRILSGSDFLSQTPVVRDGSQKLTLAVKELPSDESILIALDTDSRDSAWSNTEEIKGSVVTISGSETAAFNNKGTALIPNASCKQVS